MDNETTFIHRAQSGDPAAYAALMTQHQSGVFRLAYLMLGDADEAEDVAQETFLRAHRALKFFDPNRPLRPWLLSITANLAKNRRRALRRYLAAIQRFFYHEAARGSTPEEDYSQSWQNQQLWQAIRQLSPDAQQIIYLRFFLELSVQETAQTLAVAEGTVKSRLHRALARLKTLLEQDFPEMVQEVIYETR